MAISEELSKLDQEFEGLIIRRKELEKEEQRKELEKERQRLKLEDPLVYYLRLKLRDRSIYYHGPFSTYTRARNGFPLLSYAKEYEIIVQPPREDDLHHLDRPPGYSPRFPQIWQL